jgi:hypothetical protein
VNGESKFKFSSVSKHHCTEPCSILQGKSTDIVNLEIKLRYVLRFMLRPFYPHNFLCLFHRLLEGMFILNHFTTSAHKSEQFVIPWF